MKIKIEIDGISVNLGTIKPGKTFEFKKDVHMVCTWNTNEIEIDMEGESDCICLRMSDGKLVVFDDEDEVYPVEYEAVRVKNED